VSIFVKKLNNFTTDYFKCTMTSQFTLIVVRGRTLQLQSVDACCQFDVFVSLQS
jgi:hypothetical protein